MVCDVRHLSSHHESYYCECGVLQNVKIVWKTYGVIAELLVFVFNVGQVGWVSI